MPVGCTAWLIDDANRCLLTAGHCGTSAGSVVQFNVPTSQPDGTVVNPPPEDQYIVDLESVQSVNGGTGNDWKYFGCFPNTNTGLTPAEAQGDFYVLADSAPPAFGQSIRITGYGVDSSPSEWNQIQQTHAGPYAGVAGTTLSYETDTQGGNSGSAVLDEATGLAIGIHTHGGCDSTGGANNGTAIENGGLQTALANPQGVCIPNPPLLFQYPDGLPELLDPDGTVITVEVLGSEDDQPQPGTGQFSYDIGGGAVTAAMTEISSNVYEAAFPPIDCGTAVAYSFSAQTEGGETVLDPLNAPQVTYGATAGEGFDFSFDDDFENDFGWIVTDSTGLTTGSWERGIPAGFGDRADPPADADGSSRCYVTGLADGDNDIDDGSTTLASPRMDALSGDAHITYYRWYHNTFGGDPAADIFVVEVSADDGMSWTELEVVGPDGPEVSGGWIFRSFRVSEVITPTDTFRIRFTASDLGAGSVVEAAVDGVRMNRSASGLLCDSTCPADIDGSGAVDVDDLTQIILQWGQPGTGDINGDGTVDVDDLTEVILGWGTCG
jgi:V8-like Glu-specific endopeptidase